MTSSTTPTAYAVSPDSGEHWTAEGAWQVAEGIHRIPLPLPMDGLKAINVYVISTDDGLVLIDGGWAIPEARELLDRCLRSIGSGFGDIRRFLVTHIHRDHFTMATVLGHELGADVALGIEREAGARPVPPRVRRLRGEPVRPRAASPRAPPTSPSSGTRAARTRSCPTSPCGSTPTPGSRATSRSRSARAPSTPSTRRATRRATTSSPTGPTGCCSPVTTCCRPSRRRSASRCRRRRTRSATSWPR